MILRSEVLIFLANIFGTVHMVTRIVKYEGPPGYASNRIRCAMVNADPSFVAARINQATGACEGLTWDNWGSSPTYEPGYIYLKKKTTSEEFNPPVLAQSTIIWLIPGIFGNGGKIDVHLAQMANTIEYNIVIMDVTEETYDVYSGPSESIMVNMEVRKNLDYVIFKTWTPEQWWRNHGTDSPFPFTDDVEAKVSFIPDATHIKIYFNDRLVTSYEHPYNSHPNDAKQLRFEVYGTNNAVKISKIVFVGI